MVEGQCWPAPDTGEALNRMPGQLAESPGQLLGHTADTAESSSDWSDLSILASDWLDVSILASDWSVRV